jgi:V8-like Glu-specific endopeptidase
MRDLLKFLLIGIVMFSCGRSEDSSRQSSIYGSDDRREVFEAGDQRWRDAARSVAALVKASDISVNRLTAQSLGQKLNLCQEERFRDQPSASGCSGFLATNDTIITSGHCIKDAADCSSIKFVFDYAYQSAGSDPLNLTSDRIYSCAQIVSRQYGGTEKTDYAVIRLDRAVSGRQPLRMREQGKIESNAQLVGIGTPSGLPMKIMPNARVIKNEAASYFEANIDSFGGNSGGPVFNTSTGLVEGIIVRGREDYNIEGACTKTYVYAENADSGEDITRSSILAQALRGGVSPPNPPNPPNPPAPPAPPTPPNPPNPPAPGSRINLYANMQEVARWAYQIADDAEMISKRSFGELRRSSDDLHFAASDMYRSARRIDLGGVARRQRDLEEFLRTDFDMSRRHFQFVRDLRNSGSATYVVQEAIDRIGELISQIHREIVIND